MPLFHNHIWRDLEEEVRRNRYIMPEVIEAILRTKCRTGCNRQRVYCSINGRLLRVPDVANKAPDVIDFLCPDCSKQIRAEIEAVTSPAPTQGE